MAEAFYRYNGSFEEKEAGPGGVGPALRERDYWQIGKASASRMGAGTLPSGLK